MLQIVHLNAWSLIHHFDDIACLVSSVHPDILAVSETWLNSSVGDGEVHIPGYCLLRCDRSRCGGGVAIYFAVHLSCCILSHGPSSSGVEYLWVSIDSRLFSSPLVLGCFYRPPSLPTQSVQDVCDSIERMMTTKRNVIACGHFNVDMTALHKPHSKLLFNFLTSHSLQQPINSPTQFSATSHSILDLLIVTSDVPISKSAVLDLAISDHLPIQLDINCNIPKPPSHIVTRRSFKNFSKESFEEDLSVVSWCILDVFDHPNDKVEVFNTILLDVLNQHAPVKTVRIKKKPAPWFTTSIRKEMDVRNKLFKVFEKNRLTESWEAFKIQRNSVTSLQRKAKKQYFHRLLKNNVHPSTLWNTLKAAGATPPSQENWSSFNMSLPSIADSLNTHFVSVSSASPPSLPPSPASDPVPPLQPALSLSSTTPAWCEEAFGSLKVRCSSGLDGIPSIALIAGRSVICYPLSSILNSSISSFVFPESWKCAWVKPLHKGGDRASPSNYRPISLLLVSSKLLEKCIQQQYLPILSRAIFFSLFNLASDLVTQHRHFCFTAWTLGTRP